MKATLNGFLDDNGGLPCEGMFEWGATIDYGMKTPWQPATMGAIFSATISSLRQSQTYHFRAVARNREGYSYGNDLSFTTLGEVGMPTFVDEGDIIRVIGVSC